MAARIMPVSRRVIAVAVAFVACGLAEKISVAIVHGPTRAAYAGVP
jgi:hypothetical protein